MTILQKFIVLTSGVLCFSALHVNAHTISCSSDDGRRHYCGGNVRGARVQLVRQRSQTPCREGYSYGLDGRGLWVDRGCRGDFAFTNGGYRPGPGPAPGRPGYGGRPPYDGGGPAQVISCSSDDKRRHYCNADTRGRVRLVRQRSESPCRQGYSWGYDQRGIWVDRGCRADFQTGGR
jgi:hypothetical protein